MIVEKAGDEHLNVRTLLGRDAQELRQVHVVQGLGGAAALSRGGARKCYGTATGNEDAAVFAEGPRGVVLSVADAHAGPQASEWALAWLAEHWVQQWMTYGASAETWNVEAMDLLHAVNEYLVQQNIKHSTNSRTTLAVAILDAVCGVVLAASAGDSHVYLVGASQASAIARGSGAGTFFLGQAPASRSAIAGVCAARVVCVAAERVLVLATDGLSTEGIGLSDPAAVIVGIVAGTVAPDPARWAGTVADALATRGCQSQAANESEDDIAVAVGRLWETVEEHGIATRAWSCR